MNNEIKADKVCWDQYKFQDNLMNILVFRSSETTNDLIEYFHIVHWGATSKCYKKKSTMERTNILRCHEEQRYLLFLQIFLKFLILCCIIIL